MERSLARALSQAYTFAGSVLWIYRTLSTPVIDLITGNVEELILLRLLAEYVYGQNSALPKCSTGVLQTYSVRYFNTVAGFSVG